MSASVVQPKELTRGFFGVVSGRCSYERATVEWNEAVAAIHSVVPAASDNAVRVYLEGVFGEMTAKELLQGRSVSAQLEFRLKRFLRHFAEIERSLVRHAAKE